MAMKASEIRSAERLEITARGAFITFRTPRICRSKLSRSATRPISSLRAKRKIVSARTSMNNPPIRKVSVLSEWWRSTRSKTCTTTRGRASPRTLMVTEAIMIGAGRRMASARSCRSEFAPNSADRGASGKASAGCAASSSSTDSALRLAADAHMTSLHPTVGKPGLDRAK